MKNGTGSGLPGLTGDEEVLGLLWASLMLPVDRTAKHKVTTTYPCTAICGSSEEDNLDVTCCISHSAK